MMHDAIDLSQELSNLQRFTANFADEPDVVIPIALSRAVAAPCAHDEHDPRLAVHRPASVEATGWDVEALVHRAADVYLEMIFRDSLYHADPHPGNFLLPDATHWRSSTSVTSVGCPAARQAATGDDGDRDRDPGRRQPRRRHRRDDDTATVAWTSNELRSDIETWLNRYLLVGVGHLDVAAIMDSGMAAAARQQARAPGRSRVALPRAPPSPGPRARRATPKCG